MTKGAIDITHLPFPQWWTDEPMKWVKDKQQWCWDRRSPFDLKVIDKVRIVSSWGMQIFRDGSGITKNLFRGIAKILGNKVHHSHRACQFPNTGSYRGKVWKWFLLIRNKIFFAQLCTLLNDHGVLSRVACVVYNGGNLVSMYLLIFFLSSFLI